MVLESDRLFIKELTINDLSGLHKLQSNPNVMKYITGRPKTIDETKKELENILHNYEVKNINFLVLAVCENENDEFIGTCAVIKNEKKEYEIGYRLIEEHWGKGYGSELTRLIVSYCFEKRNLGYIVACVELGNVNSIKILEQSGFQCFNELEDEGTITSERYYRLDNQRHYDV